MINIGPRLDIPSLPSSFWPDSDNRGIDGSRHLPSVSVTHLNAFQSPTIILEPFRTVFECFISQSWSARPTKQRPGQISDDLGKSPDLYVFDQNYEHLALRRHRMLTPVTALPTIPRKGKRIQFHLCLLKKLLLGGSDRFPPHNRPITIVEDRICHENPIILLPGSGITPVLSLAPGIDLV